MHIPELKGVIERRMLINFRARPDVVEALLPSPFRPQLHRGYAVVGICLIRLAKMRPSSAPGFLGLSSENAAHRIAVEWLDPAGASGELRQGVYIPRRDTDSWINTTLGGQLFPVEQHRADFRVCDRDGRIDFEMNSRDGRASIRVRAAEGETFPAGPCFDSIEESSRFFQAGSRGYSPTCSGGGFHGLQLVTCDWSVRPLHVQEVVSSYFDDSDHFPAGSIEFDHALLMRNISHSWRATALEPTAVGAEP